MSKPHEAIITAAVQWWQGKRPIGWSEAEHLEHRRVNTSGEWEHDLADAVARLVEGMDDD